MTMDLHPTLEDTLNEFLNRAWDQLLDQGAELEAALQIHQARMQEVCCSIKEYARWVRCPTHLCHLCNLCNAPICPLFDMRRHRGRCTLLEPSFYSIDLGVYEPRTSFVSSWV